MAMHLVKTFVCNQPYDMATCLAMFTNLSASVIFISRVESISMSVIKRMLTQCSEGVVLIFKIQESECFASLAVN